MIKPPSQNPANPALQVSPDEPTHNHATSNVISANPLEPLLREALMEPGFLDDTITASDVRAYLANTSYTKVRADYENHLLTLPGMVAHARNSMVVAQEIRVLQDRHPELDETSFQNLLGDKLTGILMHLKESKQLDLSQYKAKNNHKNGYAKYLLYSHRHHQTPYCLQLFVFSPKQTLETSELERLEVPESKQLNPQRGHRTKLHNHIASCSSSILQGTLEEALYTPIQGFRKNAPLAQEIGRRIRETGSVDGFDDNALSTVHRLENIGTDQAITVHYYREMDGIEKETGKASSLRQISADLAGKANVANLYRALKMHKPADSAGS